MPDLLRGSAISARAMAGLSTLLHDRYRRAVPVGRAHVVAHDAGDPRRTLRTSEPRPLGQVRSRLDRNRNTATISGTALIVVGGASLLVTMIGAMAAHVPRALSISAAIGCVRLSDPQRNDFAAAARHPVAVPDPGRYRPLQHPTGLILVYVATAAAMTVYILEGFFARIPQDLFDAAQIDGYSDSRSSGASTCRSACPRSPPRSSSTSSSPVERVPVRGGADHRRRQAHAAARHHAFHGRLIQLDVGMIATGLMIAIAPGHRRSTLSSPRR